MKNKICDAIVLAAGASTRFNSSVPKQFLKINNKSLIDVLQEILRAINILFLPHLLIHFFVISSPLYFLHFILFLIRNIYKLKH